jgi:energy-converting hydrogenase A subunit R
VKRVFISDCEGPISRNDNAFELTGHYVPEGTRLFTIISRYDDVLADVLKRSGYKAGDTLKLILPFLKAYGITDQKMHDYSARSLVLIPNVKETLRFVRSMCPAFIVSTSYEHYIKTLCKAIRFPFRNTYCTRLKIDKYRVAKSEKVRLIEIAEEIVRMLVIEIPPNAKSLKDFSEREQNAIQRLDEIFWKEIADMEVGRLYSELDPVGGSEKAEAAKDVVQKLSTNLSDVMYVGDSITDTDAFKMVRENGGLTVSFNGNQYAIENAEIAVLSETSLVTAVLADAFCRLGKRHVLSLAENWNRETLEEDSANPDLLNSLFRSCPQRLPRVKIITDQNKPILAKESTEFRKKVRGEAIGRLG